MRNHPKPRNCKPQHRTRVVLDEAEIQRRLSKPKRPTLAERYAEANDPAERERFYTDPAQRERFYADATDPVRQQRTIAEANRRNALPPLPRRPDTTVWVTQPILRIRGWTDTAIRDFLPRPENFRSNPHVPGSRPTSLWSAATIAQSTTAWQQWLHTSLHRRGLTLTDLADSAKGTEFRHRIRTAHTAITTAQKAASKPPPE